MKVIVPDTSVLIDLERGSLLEESFCLPFEFVVPDLLYERELKDRGDPDLIELGLKAAELAGDELPLAFRYWRSRRSLSLPNSFACACQDQLMDSAYRRSRIAQADQRGGCRLSWTSLVP